MRADGGLAMKTKMNVWVHFLRLTPQYEYIAENAGLNLGLVFFPGKSKGREMGQRN